MYSNFHMRTTSRKTRRTAWIRVDKWSSLKAQQEAAARWGAEVVYTDGDGGEDWHALVRQIAPGDPIFMTDLSRIAPKRKQLTAYLLMALEAGAVIEDAEGRKVHDLSQAAAILDGIAKLSQDAKRRTTEQASAAAYARWNKVSKAEAEAAWKDTNKYRLIPDVVEATGWHKNALWDAFGARGTGLGGRQRKGNRK